MKPFPPRRTLELINCTPVRRTLFRRSRPPNNKIIYITNSDLIVRDDIILKKAK